MEEKYKLDFIYIGAPRTGTTWLSRCLECSGKVCVPSKAEISPLADNGEIDFETLNNSFKEWKPGQIKGVYPVMFMLNSENAANLKKHFPDIKIIACVRNPVERAHSGYFHNKTRRKFDQILNFEQAIKIQPKLIDAGFYYKNLKPYFDIFPKENILVMVHDDLERDPAGYLKKICEFLKVDSNFECPRIGERPNPSTLNRVKSKKLEGFVFWLIGAVNKIKASDSGRTAIDFLKRKKVDHILYFINRQNIIDAGKRKRFVKQPLNIKIRLELEKLYKDDRERLEKLIGRDFGMWRQKIKVLFLSDDTPPESPGGAGFSSWLLAKALNKLDCQVMIASGTEDKSKDNIRICKDGVEIIYFYTKYSRKLRTVYSLYNPQTLPRLKKLLLDYGPDIAHAQNIANVFSFSSLALLRRYTDKIFFTARDVRAISYNKLWEFIDYGNSEIQKDFNYKIGWFGLIRQARKSYFPGRNFIIRHWLKNCDLIFSVSHELKKALNQNYIGNIKTIWSGVDLKDSEVDASEIEKFKIKHCLIEKKIIFYSGRLSGAKGLSQAIEALAIVKKSVPNAVLTIAAKDDIKKTCEKVVKQLEIENNIVHLGWLDQKEMKIAFKSCDLVLMPSLCLDCFPRVNIEAMAAGKPVVGTCFGGTSEAVIDGETGYIVNPLNVELIAEKIIDLLENPDKAKKFGQAGYDRVKREFTIEKQAEKTKQAYEKYLLMDKLK